MNMTIHKSAEDYLEAMLMLKQERGYIRSIDVAEKLGVTKPSVSYATKRLRESGYISFDPAGMILLLPPGPLRDRRSLNVCMSATCSLRSCSSGLASIPRSLGKTPVRSNTTLAWRASTPSADMLRNTDNACLKGAVKKLERGT